MSTLTKNLNLIKPEVTDYYNISEHNGNMDIIDEEIFKTNETLTSIKTIIETHINNDAQTITSEQVGLGNVPNVTTNDQTPTYTPSTNIATLSSGEKLSIAFGKIAKSIDTLITHLADTNNPHNMTVEQVGLENVPNVTTNNQTPTYTVASSNTTLSSGETLSTAFGKIAKAVSSLISHLADTTSHITNAERTAWNNKVDASGTVANATNAVKATTATNADTLDGLHASSFIQTSQSVKVIVSTTAPSDTTAVWIVPS